MATGSMRILGTGISVYLVIRYGNDKDGANGDDTMYIVRALDCERAAEIADRALEASSRGIVNAWSDRVAFLGTSETAKGDEGIITGPLYGVGAYAVDQSWCRYGPDQSWASESSEFA